MRRNKKLLFISLLITVIGTSGLCSSYQRIISLGPPVTEQIYHLGAEDKLIANTIYCIRPADAQKKEKIGTVTKINIERVVQLRPDLVIATPLSDLKQINKLNKLGIKVVRILPAKDFSGICSNFLMLGELLGKRDKARKFITSMRREVNSIRNKLKGLPRPKVFVQIGAKPLFTANRDSFINDFIETAGGINIARDAKTGIYSREEVLKQNPDIIIIVTMGIVGEQEKKTWLKYRTLNAARTGRIHIVDAYALCSPTPVTFVSTLKEIAGLLHYKHEQK